MLMSNSRPRYSPGRGDSNKTRRKSQSGTVMDKNVPGSALFRLTEMGPEVSLVEFVSTSAAYRKTSKSSLSQLEHELLRVAPNNLMPANAASWYMAKRRFYQENPANNAQAPPGNNMKLLRFVLKSYPRKFALKGNQVEFLEKYDPNVARRKMSDLNKLGLLAYFEHKVEEYGVYFFDPYYYENTEPFHANFRQATSSFKAHRSKLIPNYFKSHSDKFVFQQLSPYMVCISKEKVDVVTNVTAVVVKMIDNVCGILQFAYGGGSAKAFFNAKTLFKDGWNYTGDPMLLPPMEFDGYRIPGRNNQDKDYAWYAVLVWSGMKPNPKYNAKLEHLNSNSYFQSGPNVGIDQGGFPVGGASHVTLEDIMVGSKGGLMLGDNRVVQGGRTIPVKSKNSQDCMQVGEVLEIHPYGAVVSLNKATGEKAWIPGWEHSNIRQKKKKFLTTTQGVELTLKDLVAFYLKPETREQAEKAALAVADKKSRSGSESESGGKDKNNNEVTKGTKKRSSVEKLKAIGCNVMVLKHNDAEPVQSSPTKKVEKKKSRKVSSSTSEMSGDGVAKKAEKVKLAAKKEDGTRVRTQSASVQPKKPKGYIHYLVHASDDDDSLYDSDVDPAFEVANIDEEVLDYEEFRDDLIPEEEYGDLITESKETIEKVHENVKAMIKEAEEAKAKKLSEAEGVTAAGDKSPIDETTDAKTPEPEKKSEPASDKPKEVAESSEPVEKSDENKPVAKSPNKSDQ